MVEDLHITLIQPALHWEDAEANRAAFAERLDALSGTTDLIVLPEMFPTGFSMRPEALAESMDGPTVSWMAGQARSRNCAITGSVIIRQKDRYYNRLIWMFPDGTFEHYDKRHLFRMGEEHAHYTAGDHRLILTWKGWRICPLVCYDLRFPVWSRNQPFNAREPGEAFDLLLYVANWPKVRRNAWSNLLVARAIENQCYVAGVNRVGDDGNGVAHSGDSVALDPKGGLMSNLPPDVEAVETVTLSAALLREFREKFPVALDADGLAVRTLS
ncbi:MAG: amidohydrolase [Bacteroidota bacterium]